MIVSELQSPDGDVKIVRSLCCQIAGYIMIYLPLGLLSQIVGRPNLRKRTRKSSRDVSKLKSSYYDQFKLTVGRNDKDINIIDAKLRCVY